jgi:integrase
MAWIKTRVTDDGDTRFVACYRDPEGRQRSAGTYSSRRAAERAAHREEAKVRDGAWHDHSRGRVTFAEYVETVWLPSKQVETSTLAAYRSYLDKHFIPTFGRRPMGKILPSEIQRWVTTASATADGLSAASVRKYHTMLHSVFERALRDRVVTFNPCAHTELPKVIKKKSRTLTPTEYVAILTALPAQHRLMVETAINTGLRWGELIALKPRHLDLIKRTLRVEETVVEVSRKNSPTGARMLTKPYPKDNEPRAMALPADLVGQLEHWITSRRLGPDDLLFATREGTPISRNTFRTRIGRPAIRASGIGWVMRRSPPRRNTCMPFPTPTPRTSTPSTASAANTGALVAVSTPASAQPGRLSATTRKRLGRRSAKHRPQPRDGYPPSQPPESTSTSVFTTSATPTPPGSWPADPTSSPSWTAWATPRSPLPRNSSALSPTPGHEPGE